MKRFFPGLALILPIAAYAYCAEPSFPYTPHAPQKPDKPICVVMRSCTQWDVDQYKSEMDAYVVALKRYVQEAQEVADRYAEEALAYAKCKLRSD